MVNDDLWAVWPDGFMCEFRSRDMEEALGYRSDDYELVRVVEYAKDGELISWLSI